MQKPYFNAPTLYVRVYRKFDDPLPYKSVKSPKHALLTAHSHATGAIKKFLPPILYLKKPIMPN